MTSLDDHATAVLALLNSADLTLFEETDGGPQLVPNAAVPPYVVVHFVPQRALGPTLEATSNRMVLRFITHSVGATEKAARILSDIVADAVLNVIPTVPGRNCAPIRQDVGQDPRIDETTGVTAVTITEAWRLESLPGEDAS